MAKIKIKLIKGERKHIKKVKKVVCKVKLIEGGQLPTKKTEGAACYDCYARTDVKLSAAKPVLIPLGFAMEIPKGYCAKIYPRSSIGLKTTIREPNSVGIIDSDYRGEVNFIAELKTIPDISEVFNSLVGPFQIKAGERICQMMIEKVVNSKLKLVEELSDTERGEGGFGSTGK